MGEEPKSDQSTTPSTPSVGSSEMPQVTPPAGPVAASPVPTITPPITTPVNAETEASPTPVQISASPDSTDLGVSTSNTASTSTSFEPPSGSQVVKVVGLLVFAVVVIGGFAFGGYYLGSNKVFIPAPAETPEASVTPTPSPTATPDPTANWKVFEDTKNGYSFKYSPDFAITDYSEAGYKGKLATFLGEKQIKTEAGLTDGIRLSTIVIPNVKKDFKTYVGEAADLEKVDDAKVSEVKLSSVDGIAAYEYTVDNKTSEARVVFVKLNGGLIRIAGAYAGENKAEYLSTINQIISTFKFVESTPSPTATPKSE